MKRSFDIICLQIVLILKLLATALILVFPQALLGLFCPFGIFSPLLVGAMVYSEIPKSLLSLVVILMIIATVLLVVSSICIIVNPKCAVSFAPVLVFCYTLEGISYVFSLIFGNLVFTNLIGIVFNALIVKFLWSVRKKNKREGSVS